MPKSTVTAGQLLDFVLNGATLPFTEQDSFYVALHSADPTPDGDQSTHEIVGNELARPSIRRDETGFELDGATVTNVASLQCVRAASNVERVATHISIGLKPTGAGQLVHYCALAKPFSIAPGTAPIVPARSLTVTEL